MRRIFGLVIILLLAGCGGPSEADLQSTVSAAISATSQAQMVATSVSATQQAEAACAPAALSAYAETIEQQIHAFEQQADLAGSTPRIGLATPLQRLLDIQTETRQVSAPQCLENYHQDVLYMMDLHQKSLQNFAVQGNDSETTRLLLEGQAALDQVKLQLDGIRQGTFPPTSTPQANDQ